MNFRFAIVDDAAFIRELIKSVLTAQGAICVGEADDGASGVKLVSQTLPDLVFLDMVMPKKNGIEAALEMREIWPNIKIIGCSTVDNDALVAKARGAGIERYVTKPFTKDQLLGVVKELMIDHEEIKK